MDSANGHEDKFSDMSDYVADVRIKTEYRDRNHDIQCSLDKEASIMTYALRSLGFYAEIADYVAVESRTMSSKNSAPYTTEHCEPILLTNANKIEFLTLWDDDYLCNEDNEMIGQWDEKYNPIDETIFFDYCEGEWQHPPYVYLSGQDTVVCGFAGIDQAVRAKINQPPNYKSDKVICFYSKGEYPQFSNFYPAELEVDVYLGKNSEGANRYYRRKCSSVEHYFQIMKALEFDLEGETLKQMGNHLTCAEIKALGRKVQNFDAGVWNIRRRFHMRDAVAMKFWQNRELQELLLSTGDAILAEASPRDTFWGIGYSGKNPKAHDPAAWRGRNVLGNMLMYLRAEIACQCL